VNRALTRDPRSAIEREQAIKLVRAFVDVEDCIDYIPLSVLRTLVAIASQPDDSLYHIALETLCEIGKENFKVKFCSNKTSDLQCGNGRKVLRIPHYPNGAD
jgi:hypothetical protein